MRPYAIVAALALAVVATGCRTYKQWPKLARQDGYDDIAAYAAYGPEQAQKVAMGRKLAELYEGDSWEARARQVKGAVEFAKTMKNVVDVKADTTGYWLTVRFKSGWRVAVLPIADGVKAESTPGL